MHHTINNSRKGVSFSTIVSRFRTGALSHDIYWKIIAPLFILMAILSTQSLRAQKYALVHPAPLDGVITGKNGQPLSGVKVATLPHYSETYSDKSGRFRIAVSESTRQLQLEKSGYATLVIDLNTARSPLAIQMKLSTEKNSGVTVATPAPLYDEAVIIGYGRQPKRSFVGSAPIAATGLMIRGTSGYYTPNTESYAHQKENGFKATVTAPLSTFSIDVDKASYSNVRRFINDGALPPEDAVRVEELINYFDYHYQQPTGKAPVHIQTELAAAPWNPAHYLLKVGLQAKKVETANLPASNLVFLIDVSGSMAASNKLPLLISSFKMLTDQLREQDYVSIVTYAGSAQNVLPPTSGADKNRIKSALGRLQAYGSTNGAGGLEQAYTMAEKHFKKGANNRIILASDGEFNVGINSVNDLEDLIAQKRKSGIYLSVLGFGMGNFKDDKMETLADKGNGNYAYIDNSAEARRVLLKEFGGTLFTVAKDVKVQVEFNPGVVQAYRLVGYENRALQDEDFNRDTVDAGEMGSGSTVTALYEIIPNGVNDGFSPMVDTLRYDFDRLSGKNAMHGELATVKIRYKEPDGDKSKLIGQIVANKAVSNGYTSADFQLAAAAAGWGMLLKNSPYKQKMTYPLVEELIKQALKEDQTGEIGSFLTLVKTSEALVGNEVISSSNTNTELPPIQICPRPVPTPRPRPRLLHLKKRPLPRTSMDGVTPRDTKPHQSEVRALNGKLICVYMPVNKQVIDN